jgi:cyclic-di-GMP phosphodiesterase TipF (flagellum assembly factor)
LHALRHVLAVVGYATIAVAAALALPRFAPAAAGNLAIAFGGMMFLGFALAHEALARRGAVARLAAEVATLRAEQQEATRDVRAARVEIGRLFEALTAGDGRGVRDLEKDVDKVTAEVRLLHNLVNQLAPRPKRAAPSQPDIVAELLDASPVARAAVRAGPLRAAEGRALDDGEILRIIRDGLRQDRIELVLQPIVSLPQRKHKFYEAFTRISAEDGKTVLPEQYIAIAEREGLITAIDNMLLFRCVQLLRVSQKKSRALGFFCNISPYTLADRGFFRDFVAFMTGNAELAPNLIFEFAQSAIANRDEEIDRQLARLAGMGFRYSVDQVASLNLDYPGLARRNVRFIKIDAATLLAEGTSAPAQLPVGVKDFKRALDRQGIDLIVEKVETEATLRDLLDFNIDFGQGYLFGEPKPAKAA